MGAASEPKDSDNSLIASRCICDSDRREIPLSMVLKPSVIAMACRLLFMRAWL